jgi:hypothetical protein
MSEKKPVGRKALNSEIPKNKTLVVEDDEIRMTSRRVQKMFDTYYHMGQDRDIRAFARMQMVPLETVMDVYETYGWAQKIKDLDDIKEREFEDWFKFKSKRIREKLTNQLASLLDSMDDSTLGLPLAVSTVADLKTVSSAYSELVRATDIILRRPALMEDTTQPTTWSDLLEDVAAEKGILS